TAAYQCERVLGLEREGRGVSKSLLLSRSKGREKTIRFSRVGYQATPSETVFVRVHSLLLWGVTEHQTPLGTTVSEGQASDQPQHNTLTCGERGSREFPRGVAIVWSWRHRPRRRWRSSSTIGVQGAEQLAAAALVG
ncbi:unnamed protein product, partial [Ectocarpus sp. 12 AP-2014]